MNEATLSDALGARAAIAAGKLRGSVLRMLLLRVAPEDRDPFADAMLGIDGIPDDELGLPSGVVPYLPCAVDDIMAMVEAVPLGPNDELVDLGSGLGKVVILAHLLSGARTRGVEIQEHLVRESREHAATLRLPDVSFVHGDAAEVELSGSVFFLYAPFNGPLRARVLRRLEELSKKRPIVVAAVDIDLSPERWLKERSEITRALTLYDSRAPAAHLQQRKPC